MSKKLTFLASIIAASVLVAGCSNVVKDNSLKAIHLTPNIQGSPMVAELDVADKKVIGQAKGKTISKSELEKEAVAEALKQADGDVLVGANFFYVDSTTSLTVTVIGYPARYKNFKPKEVCEVNNDVLIGGNFSYEDGSKNNIQVTIKNPKPATTAPAAPPISVAPQAAPPVAPAQNTKSTVAAPQAAPAAPVAPANPVHTPAER